MSDSANSNYTITHPRPEHFSAIQELCRRVYPFTKPWSIAQLESHRLYFPDGQLIVIEEESKKVIGLAFSLIIDWDDYSSQDSWRDFTAAGFFSNHNPRKGKTLYGAEVMVDGNYRGQGIGCQLYEARREIARKYGLKRIRAGARLRGYHKFKDKMAPEEYVRQVINKEIYDPTLSFQLNQEFKVINVAKNYLLDDPESLGYAALIEWLNPEAATTNDFKKQQASADLFATGLKFVPEHLPRELRRVVRKATATLGQIIREAEGEKFFRRVESYREKLKKTRVGKKKEILENLLRILNKETPDQRLKLAHAFSLQLEIVNACESAYRTWRGRQRSTTPAAKSRVRLNFVLTAHPTEARSVTVVEILNRIENLLIQGLESQFTFNDNDLSTQFRMLWLQPIFKTEAPKVSDEAEYIYSLIFSPDIIDFIATDHPSYDLRLRTWVGGDKDGHPGVNEVVMKECLQGSRTRIISIIQKKLTLTLADLQKVQQNSHQFKFEIKTLTILLKETTNLNILRIGDGSKVKKWAMQFRRFLERGHRVATEHYQVLLVKRMLEIFPGLVLPLELRDHANEIAKALTNESAPIRRMLALLGKMAGPMGVNAYAAGLVVSNCESDQDLTAACALVKLAAKDQRLPVIPLLESREALLSSKKILSTWLKDPMNLETVRRHWDEKFEIMVGYSDSAKQLGVLASRTLIRQAMADTERVLRRHRLRPIFFHGSGGSVARGGGSLKEQVAWWPDSAVARPKLTIQGEMIQRVFATKEILHSQCSHLSQEALRRKIKKLTPQKSPVLNQFVGLVEQEYCKLIADSTHLSVLLGATPYRYLDRLRIGSRPSKRPDPTQSFSTLRAIPWVLCWTQSRVLLPAWWGIGTAWYQLSQEQRNLLIKQQTEDPFFSSFVKALGFTLSKVELDVWELYFDKGNTKLLDPIRKEYEGALKFVREVSQHENLIWHRPWLEESIRLRAPHIHLLNLLQIIAMKEADESLLRETLVGIACGMLTTG